MNDHLSVRYAFEGAPAVVVRRPSMADDYTWVTLGADTKSSLELGGETRDLIATFKAALAELEATDV